MRTNKIKTEAVENFLSSMDLSLSKVVHVENAISDSRLYKWNYETLKAIIRGIEDKYEGRNP